MGDRMTNVDGAAAFCERCGKPGHERAGDLEPCGRCGLLACAADRPAPGICVTCAEAARLGARRPRLARPGPTLASPVQQPVAVAEPPVDRRPPEPAAGTSVRRRLVLGTLGFAAAATLLAVLVAGNLNAPGGGEAASPPAGAVGFATGTPEKTPPFTGAEAGPSGSVASGAPV